MTLQLRALTLSDEASFLAAIDEFRRHEPSWDFAFGLSQYKDFPSYLAWVNGWPAGKNLPGGFVPNSFLVGVVGDRVVGRLSLRHELNDFLARLGGHIGYGVIPSERRKGYAGEMLRQALAHARSLGLARVLLTCDDDNIGSIRTIERQGGVLEDKVFPSPGAVAKRRYWIG